MSAHIPTRSVSEGAAVAPQMACGIPRSRFGLVSPFPFEPAGAALQSWQAGAVQFTAKICGLVGRATMADPPSAGGALSSLSARCVKSGGTIAATDVCRNSRDLNFSEPDARPVSVKLD